MTIGKNSRKSSIRSSIRAPKFLDKSSGFYGRLDEPETAGMEEEQRWNGTDEGNKEGGVVRSQTPSVVQVSGANEKEEVGVFGFDEGMMEDDGETLLQRKPSRRSSRWRRSSRRKQKEAKSEEEEEVATDDRLNLGTESPDSSILEGTRVIIEVEMERVKKMEEEKQKEGKGTESALAHFTIKEDADDQVLIRDKKRGREEEAEEERRMREEQEEGMKVVKRNTLKNYRKAFDRAFRRGWEAFIANLYSVTLTPVTPSSPSPSSPVSKKKHQHSSVLAEFQ